VSYSEMMAIYADVAGLPQRRLLRVPFLMPGLSSHRVGLVTPVPVPLARELVESLVNEVTLGEHAAPEWLLGHLVGLREAITMALAATPTATYPRASTTQISCTSGPPRPPRTGQVGPCCAT
jgi:hypothetical protein